MRVDRPRNQAARNDSAPSRRGPPRSSPNAAQPTAQSQQQADSSAPQTLPPLSIPAGASAQGRAPTQHPALPPISALLALSAEAIDAAAPGRGPAPHRPAHVAGPSDPLDLLADAAATRQPLAQLHLQQGPNIDQWRSSALGGLDAATHLDMVRQSLVNTHQALTGLPDRPAWRVRRASTLATIVEETIVRFTELAQQPYDAPAIVAIYHALQRMAPEAFAQQRGAFLLGVRSVAERIINSAGKELATIEQAFAAFEHILPEMHVGFEQDAEHALRQGLVSALWYRLVDVHDALSVWNIQSWTSRSYTVCRMRACPQLAALVWLRTLLSLPTIQVEQCVVLTQQLREAWATPRPGPLAPAPMQSLVDPGHLPADLDFEPIARAQLSTWIAVLPEQLPSLAPFEADPIREVFAQLADALQMQIDVEMGLPITDGDAEMQARELAEFIQDWEQEHDRPFPGYEALFSSDDAWFAGSRFTQQPLNDFVLYDDDSP